MRNMRDQTRALANDLSSVRVQMAADVEQSGVELRDSQESFEADRQRFRGETPEGSQHQSSGSHHHYISTDAPPCTHLKENEESGSRRPHVVAENEPMLERTQTPLCAICGERTNRRVYQDRDPQSPTYREYSTTCSNTCRDLERRAIQEVDMMARVRLLSEQRAADEMSTVSGESSGGSQNRSSRSQQQSRSSRQWRSVNLHSHRPSKPVSSSGHHNADGRGRGGSDGGSSSSSQPYSRRSTRSHQSESALAQALLQSTKALAANQSLCSQLQLELSELRNSNQALMESNQANQANNAVLARRL